MDLGGILNTAVAVGIPLVLAITLHEAAHGYVAYRLGDPTAKKLGRLTLDPIKHIDPFGTIIMPGMMLLSGVPFLFGYAKPVPVDMRNFAKPLPFMAITAFAGPASNIFQAMIAAILLHVSAHLGDEAGPWLAQICQYAIFINCLLAAFNLLPFPPLDGSKMILPFLPKSVLRPFLKFEQMGMVLLLAVIALPPLLGLPFNPIWAVLSPVYDVVLSLVVTVTGHV